MPLPPPPSLPPPIPPPQCHWAWFLYHAVSNAVCRKVNVARESMKSSDGFNVAVDDQDQVLSPTEKIRGPHFDLGVEGNFSHAGAALEAIKYIWSAFVTIGSIAIVFYGIGKEAYVLKVSSGGAFCIMFIDLAVLFFLEGLMICIVETQYWDPESWREAYPRAYKIHKLVNQPDNLKRFIIGRQFCTVLTGFLLAQIFTLDHMTNEWGWPDALYYVVVKSGLVGVMIVLAHGQLMPELLAAEYPLRFMDMYGQSSSLASLLVLCSCSACPLPVVETQPAHSSLLPALPPPSLSLPPRLVQHHLPVPVLRRRGRGPPRLGRLLRHAPAVLQVHHVWRQGGRQAGDPARAQRRAAGGHGQPSGRGRGQGQGRPEASGHRGRGQGLDEGGETEQQALIKVRGKEQGRSEAQRGDTRQS